MPGFGDPITEKDVRRAKRVNFAALIGVVVLLVTMFYFFKLLEGKNEELKMQKEELAELATTLDSQSTKLESMNAELIAARNLLARREQETSGRLNAIGEEILHGSVSKARALAAEYEEAAIDKGDEQDYYVTVFTYEVDKKLRGKIDQYLEEQQFVILHHEILRRPVRWFAKKPTVFFYDKVTESVAREVCNQLTEITGVKFNHAFGAPEEVPEMDRPTRINIHFPNPDAPVQQRQIPIQEQIRQKKSK